MSSIIIKRTESSVWRL